MTSRPRPTLSNWKRGQVLRLKDPLDGIREGWFAFIERDVAAFRVCRLGENHAGDLCTTDETHDVHVDFEYCFMPEMNIMPIRSI